MGASWVNRYKSGSYMCWEWRAATRQTRMMTRQMKSTRSGRRGCSRVARGIAAGEDDAACRASAVHRRLSKARSADDRMSNNEEVAPSATVGDVLDAAIVRSSSILDGGNFGSQRDDANAEAESEPNIDNLSVTPTALAHSLWQSTGVPYRNRNTVIDATCNNGKDCLTLVRMLFPDSINGSAP
ncbi:hypothetical protein ACHAWF_008064 [Thalassiosira exigua]